MRNLIDKKQAETVVCDNVNCDFEVANDEHALPSEQYINIPCPKCGENLLTVEDYMTHKRLMKAVNFINKWFSWVTIFSGKIKPDDITFVKVHVHNGVKFKCNPDK